ncbi:hypothetical protein ACEUAB_19850 [Aeromonas veronii]
MENDFIKVESKDVNLKFVFDNLRNYGISAIFFYTGTLIFKNGSFIAPLDLPYISGTVGVIIMVTATILTSLNFVQGTIALLAVKKLSFVPYIVITLLLHLVLFEFFFYRALNG